MEEEKLEPIINKKQETEIYDIESTAVMTGDRNQKRFLYYQLKRSMLQAKKIDIIVAFLMESGVKMLLQDLKQALNRGATIRILTGNYLGITQPSALYLLKMELGDRIDLRFYNESKRSFHPKAYIFHREVESEIYIGSSNISRSALTSAIEWNYRFSNQTDPKNFNLFYETFEDLFAFHSIPIDEQELKQYAKNWKRPAVAKDLEQYEETKMYYEKTIEPLFQPRGAQIEALYALKTSRLEGAQKALIQAATGIGKTYLAAFDSATYSHVLFLAHREEILKQAADSFYHVRQSKDYGFFYGKQKDTNQAVIFASVASLGKKEYLKKDYFPEDYFDYIIIDETHHAANDSYKRILAYFKPKFLLGLTATPERMDGKSIYEIYDYHVSYEISLKEAINKGLLVPFHYYGIYDELSKLDKQTITIQEQIQNEYFRIKELLNGKIPTRMDLFTYMEDRIYLLCICHAKENPFRGYLEYLYHLHELSEEEERFYHNISREFFYLLETTNMQKSYKMPVLSAFCSNGILKTAVTEEEVLKCWKCFYQQRTNWKDLKKGITYSEFQQISDRQHMDTIKRNPIRFLKESGKGFFIEKDGYLLALREELSIDAVHALFQAHMEDIIAYRTVEYYQRRYLNDKES